jgi:hypothetical protein
MAVRTVVRAVSRVALASCTARLDESSVVRRWLRRWAAARVVDRVQHGRRGDQLDVGGGSGQGVEVAWGAEGGEEARVRLAGAGGAAFGAGLLLAALGAAVGRQRADQRAENAEKAGQHRGRERHPDVHGTHRTEPRLG